MNVRIQTLDNTPVPRYETSGAVAFDVQARKKTVIPPKSLGYVPTGLIVEIPQGYMLALCSRSSTPKKKGLMIPHGIGIIDQDYCGPEDEMLLQYYNFTDEEVIVEQGERCGQGVFVQIGIASFSVEKSLATTSRGGFGSTGS